jgi:hypothetical protein
MQKKAPSSKKIRSTAPLTLQKSAIKEIEEERQDIFFSTSERPGTLIIVE